jgi:hypothetical protein
MYTVTFSIRGHFMSGDASVDVNAEDAYSAYKVGIRRITQRGIPGALHAPAVVRDSRGNVCCEVLGEDVA